MRIVCFFNPQAGIACERKRKPELIDRPLALSSLQSRVIVVSPEAAERGIGPGHSLSSAHSLHRDLQILPYDREAYDLAARSLWDLIAVETSVIEPTSPEMVFAVLDGPEIRSRTLALLGALTSMAGVPVQAGLGSTRMVARTAARRAAPGELLEAPPENEARFLAPTPLSEVDEIDTPTRQRLDRLGIRTLGEVRRIPQSDLHRQFRQTGLLLSRRSAGIDDAPIRALWPPRTHTEQRNFEDAVTDAEPIQLALEACSAGIAHRLIFSMEYCRTLTIRIETESAPIREMEERLRSPINRTTDILSAARRILSRIPLQSAISSIELRAGDLGPGSGVQLSLLDATGEAHADGLPHERRRRLESAVSGIRARFGAASMAAGGTSEPPSRIRLWTYPLSSRRSEEIRVETDSTGAPLRYTRGGETIEVYRIHSLWRETEWFWEGQKETTAYRIETRRAELIELHHTGDRWRIGAVAD